MIISLDSPNYRNCKYFFSFFIPPIDSHAVGIMEATVSLSNGEDVKVPLIAATEKQDVINKLGAIEKLGVELGLFDTTSVDTNRLLRVIYDAEN